MVSRTSPLASRVLMASFLKKTGMFLFFSCRMYFRQSRVLRANLLIDLVKLKKAVPGLYILVPPLSRVNYYSFFKGIQI